MTEQGPAGAALRIIVCVKQVPHPEHFGRIGLDPARQTIAREGIPAVINPLDRNALEEALLLRERRSGRVTVISMGPPRAREVLEESLAVGADDAILLCDSAFAGADTLATAYSLARGIRKAGPFDVVLCGNSTVDGGTSQVGPQLAELLDIPHAACVSNMALGPENTILATRSLERGRMKVRLRMPALLSVVKEINQPRLPTLWGIMESRSKEIRVWSADDIGASQDESGLAGSPTRVAGIFKCESKRCREMLEGRPEDMARKAVARLSELGAL